MAASSQNDEQRPSAEQDLGEDLVRQQQVQPPGGPIVAFLIALVAAIALGVLVWFLFFRPANQSGTAAEDPAVTGARQALQAWGTFAVTGDLSKLDAAFSKEGPQYRQLQNEVARLRTQHAAPPPYQFKLTNQSVLQAPQGMRVVRGVVTLSHPGERARSFRWDIYMRQEPSPGGRWRLWTVTNSPR